MQPPVVISGRGMLAPANATRLAMRVHGAAAQLACLLLLALLAPVGFAQDLTFTPPSGYTFSLVPETSGAVSAVGLGTIQINTSHADVSTLNCAIASGDTSRFSISTTDSGVRVGDYGQCEIEYIGSGEPQGRRYSLVVRATGTNSSISDFEVSNDATYSIHVDSELTFTPASGYSFSLTPETSGSPSRVELGFIEVRTSNADVSTLNCAIASGDTSRFQIRITDDGVKVGDFGRCDIDYIGTGESEIRRYTLVVRATGSNPDNANLEIINNATYYVDVDGLLFAATQSYTFDVLEGVAASTASPIRLGVIYPIDSARLADSGMPKNEFCRFSGDSRSNDVIRFDSSGRFQIENRQSTCILSYIGAALAADTPDIVVAVDGLFGTRTVSALFTVRTVENLMSFTFNLNQYDNYNNHALIGPDFTIVTGSGAAIALGVVSIAAEYNVTGYSIISINSVDRFSIDNAGALSYIGTTGEAQDTSFAILATDGQSTVGGAEVHIAVQGMAFVPQQAYTFTLAADANGTAAPIFLGTIVATDGLGFTDLRRNYYHFLNGSLDNTIDFFVDSTRNFGLRGSDGVGSLYYIGSGTAQTTSLDIVARTSYNFNRRTTAAFFVDLVDVNFDQEVYIFTLSRGADGSDQAILLGSVRARDSGGESVAYVLDRSSTLFSLSIDSGALYYVGGIPASGRPYVELDAIRILAGAGNAAQTGLRADDVVIRFVVQNDQAPQFTENLYAFNLDSRASGTPDAIVLGTISATDSIDLLSFSISSGNDGDRFSIESINNNSAILRYIGEGETLSAVLYEYPLEISVSDALTDPANTPAARVSRISVLINLIGLRFVNPGESYSFTLDQGYDGRETPIVLGTIHVTDINGDNYTFAVPAVQNISQVTTGGLNAFQIDAAGVLRYHGSGAFSSDGRIDLGVTVLSYAPIPAGERNERSLQTEVAVSLRNNSAPVFTTGDSYRYTLEANASGLIVLGTIEAIDANSDAVSYRLVDTSDDRFTIGATSGILSYTSTTSVGTADITFNVVANDSAGNTGQAPVAITTLGLRFSQVVYTFSLKQGVPEVLGTVAVIDPNAGTGGTIVFTITGQAIFSISQAPNANGVNGVVHYNGSGFRGNVLTVNATKAGQAIQARINIESTEAPVFTSSAYTFNVNADSDGTTTAVLVGAVSASDPNGDQVMYTLIGNSSDRFTIEVADGNGVVSYIGSGEAIDSSLTLTVEASNGATDQAASSASITIQFIGLRFEMAEYTFTTLNKGESGAETPHVLLGTVTVNNPTGNAINYAFSDPGKFLIEARGDPQVVASGDTQAVVSYIGGGEQNSGTYTLTATSVNGSGTTAIIVQLNNNGAPTFLANAYTFALHAVDSGVSTAVAIGTVTATDPNREAVYYRIGCDAGDSFSEQVTCDNHRFSVGPNNGNGILYYTGSGATEGTQISDVFIRAHDSDSSAAGVPVHQTLVRVSINVVSLQFESPLTTFNLNRGQAGNLEPVVLGTFTARSLGGGESPQYAIDDAAHSGAARFSIGLVDGEFSYIGSGESGETPNIGLIVTATVTTAFGVQATSLEITVEVQNEAPGFQQTRPYTFALDADYSGAQNPIMLGSVSATDANDDTVIYAIIAQPPSSGGGDSSAKFSIHATQGTVYYIGSGEVLGAQLTLRINASDGLSSPPNTLVTIVVGRQTIERNTLMTQHSLAQAGRNITVDTVDVLGSRFVAAPHVVLSGYSLDSRQMQRLKRWTQLSYWQQGGAWDGVEREFAPFAGLSGKWSAFRDKLVSGTSFLIPLSAQRGRNAVVDSRFALWGQGRISGYSRERQGLKAGGSVVSGYFGVDYTMQDALFSDDRLLLGVALSQSRLDGYSRMSDGTHRIDIKATINTLYPYLQWRSEDGFVAWGMFGYGVGDVKLTTETANTVNPEADVSLLSLAGGVRHALRSIGNYTVNSAELALKADAFMVHTESKSSAGLDAAQSDSHRFRLALADQRRWPVGDVAYSGGFELGARLDGGDSADGYGIDIGANVGFANTGIGLSVYSQGRLLLLHSEDYSEWGLDVTVRLRPRFQSRRLALLLKPGWGQQSAADGERLWQHGAAALDSAAGGNRERSLLPDRTHLSLSYGLQYYRALLQPFLEMDMARDAVSHLKLGLRLSAANLRLTLSGDQARRRIGIDGTLGW